MATITGLLGIAVLCVQLWNEIQKAMLIALEKKKKLLEIAVLQNNFPPVAA
jgi:hypothetical protein